MSYLTLPQLPSFNKCIISFWFRVPQESLDASYNAQDDESKDPLTRNGILPLVVFGKEGTDQTDYDTVGEKVMIYDATVTTTAYALNPIFDHVDCTNWVNVYEGLPIAPLWCCEESAFYYYVPPPTVESGESIVYGNTKVTQPKGPADPSPPSYIGVSFGALSVNFETAQKPKVTAYNWDVPSISPSVYSWNYIFAGYQPGMYGPSMCDRSGACGPGCVLLLIECWRQCTSDIDIPYIDSNQAPEFPCPAPSFVDTSSLVMDQTGALLNSGNNNTAVTADKWHHVLVSVDMSKGIKSHGIAMGDFYTGNPSDYVTSVAKLYTAFDDENLTELDVSDNWNYPDGGPNDVITEQAWRLTGAVQNSDACNGVAFPVGGIPQYTLDNMKVPAGSLGIPATAKYVDDIYKVEMAEFQMWLGQSLDPADEGKRRLFLAPKKDKNDGNLYPVDPKVAANALGRPDVLLHRSGNWIRGKDTGKLGISIDQGTGKQTIISQGQLQPTGLIKKYKPDPSIPAR